MYMLDDLRVIDLSNHVSGSYTSKLLASLGAHVIKVEKPSIGDRSRNIGPFLFKSMYKESSLLFRYLNTLWTFFKPLIMSPLIKKAL